MKTTNIYIIVLTLFFSVSLQAQTKSTSEANELFDGLVNTFQDVKDDINETANDVKNKPGDVLNEIKDGLDKISFWEKFMQGDILLVMKADKDKPWRNITESNSDYTEGFYYLDLGDNSLEIKFDWDNRALIMEGESSGYSFGKYSSHGEYEIFGKKEKELVQYTDKDGNWYSPVEDMEGYEHIKYIKFNAKQMAVSGLQGLLDLSIDSKVEEIKNYLFQLILHYQIDLVKIGAELGGSEYSLPLELHKLLQNFDEKNAEFQKKLEEAIKAILSKELEEIGGFPIFIHWAFIYSPEVIKKYYGNKVNETKSDCDGYANACSKFTVLQGPDKGKSMEFDRLGRLKFINSLEDGTAKFFYDKDITVTLPDPSVVMSLSDLTGDIFKQRNMEENYEKKRASQREEERELKNEETQQEIDQMRQEELESLREDLKEAVTPQEREAIQEKIKDLEKLM
ncbi:hypothetical protein KO566_12865 [Flavobacteriaceae bacterium XHP0103]|uniref:hypothetical protein n=1 Tax=Marixanthotalea marina TaxID=2844359 RepID=UPI002989A4D8|nr:hypothetical protein [Marixanthotalea marina]MBU3822955.1 hypothetical protein [Marixanthotalea marina]